MIYHDSERRRWKRYPISILARLIFPRRSIKDVHDIQMRLVDVSEGGASIASRIDTIIPDYFYIKFPLSELGMISSYVIERTEELIRCKFCHKISARELEAIINYEQTDAAFSSLF